ncbi:hypothetical protein AAFN88_16675 [Pelagibius sp. CAU 1746]|uniref:hypothetical protein n=1 Tax=Pelagibius sp. CAU 1746 TaxID=3140370 RepID=UPI00325A6AD6
MSNFAFFVVDGIETGNFTEGETENAFQFMNDLGSSDSLDIQNLLVVAIFEKLVDSEECRKVAHQRLEGKARDLFERTLAGWPSSWPLKINSNAGEN